MTPVKVTSAIILYFLARTAMSACEPYSGFGSTYTLCWHDKTKSFISQTCLTEKCDALNLKLKLKSPVKTQGGQNPSAMACKDLGLKVLVLRDEQNNEQSFCQFKDGSLKDANAIYESAQ